jgi:hypothetical protein
MVLPGLPSLGLTGAARHQREAGRRNSNRERLRTTSVNSTAFVHGRSLPVLACVVIVHLRHLRNIVQTVTSRGTMRVWAPL